MSAAADVGVFGLIRVAAPFGDRSTLYTHEIIEYAAWNFALRPSLARTAHGSVRLACRSPLPRRLREHGCGSALSPASAGLGRLGGQPAANIGPLPLRPLCFLSRFELSTFDSQLWSFSRQLPPNALFSSSSALFHYSTKTAPLFSHTYEHFSP